MRFHLLSHFYLLTLLVLPAALGGNLLVNDRFDAGLDGWTVSAPAGAIHASTAEGRTTVRIAVPPTEQIGFPHIYQEFQVGAGDILKATASIRAETSEGGKGPYLSFSFFGSQPDRLGFTQSESTHDSDRWTEIQLVSIVPSSATMARLALIFHGHGCAEFESAALYRTEGGWNEVEEVTGTLEIHPEPAFPLQGFGVEDDGWFFNQDNLGKGFSEGDVQIREDRILDLDPDLIRMFIWYKDWNPSSDWETFDFETDNMRSRYRTLDLYQKIGAKVNIVGVEWGIPDPYQDPPKVARAIGALMEHLIREKGYTCIQDWTLSNEPNHYFPRTGYTFEVFKALHLEVDREFQRRKLEIRLVGSDDAQDFLWFRKCIEDPEYRSLIGAVASHRYFKDLDRFLAPDFFDSRIRSMEETGCELPLMLTEFGFQDDRSGTFENPIMKSYDYALWTMTLAIEGLNLGFSGFNIWTLQEVDYPGKNRMVYGLWDDKSNAWKLRPVYFAWRLFCQMTEPGEQVTRCEIEPFRRVKAAKIDDTIFWVNESEEQKTVDLGPVRAVEGRFWNEELVGGEHLQGNPITMKEGQLRLPPRSFGFFKI